MKVSSRLVSGLRGLVLGAPDALKATKFYSDNWGLYPVGEGDNLAYFRANGPEHHVLALENTPELGLRAIELAAPDHTAINDLYRKARASGAAVRTQPAALVTPGGGYGFELIDIDGRRLRISTDVEAVPSRRDLVRPNKVSHVVLNSPDIERSRAFYCELFGFAVSDRSADQMVFIRCDGAHHNIAFNKNPYVSFNHVAFEMSTFEAVMRGVGRMKDAGMPVQWGTGCHGIGHIMFAYFIDPNGFTIEYNFYVTPFNPATHEPRTWPRSRENMDAWGTAGPPSETVRKAMAGVPMPPAMMAGS